MVDCRVGLRVDGYIFIGIGTASLHFFINLHITIFITEAILVETLHDISTDVGDILHNVIGTTVVLTVIFRSIRA
jgi:hypothetical protein